IEVIEANTLGKKLLLKAANPLASYSLGQLRFITLKTKNGIPLYCKMHMPVNFDSTKKYPAIVYWYGGSHAQLVGNGWNGGAGDYWFQYMAERGFVVFVMDTRGSDNRGKAFEQAMFRKIGDVQMEDMMTAV